MFRPWLHVSGGQSKDKGVWLQPKSKSRQRGFLVFDLITVKCWNQYGITCIILGVRTGTQNFSSQTLSLSPFNLCFNNNRKHLGSWLWDSRKSWNGQMKCQSSLSFRVQNYKLSERPSAFDMCVCCEKKKGAKKNLLNHGKCFLLCFLPSINWDLAGCDTA